MMDNDQWTLGRLLEWTTEYLERHGAETPRLDAEVLLAEAHGCQRIELYTSYEELASEETRVAALIAPHRAEARKLVFVRSFANERPASHRE